MYYKLKQDLVIPAGTVFDDIVPIKTERTPDMHCGHTIGFGRNACGSLIVGTEPGDPEFDEWFEAENEEN